MKRFLLLLILLCLGALSLLAQQQKPLPVVQSDMVLLQPPRIIVRIPSMARTTWGRIHYGGEYAKDVIFLQPLAIYIQPARVVYLPANAADSLFGRMLRLHKQGWQHSENSGKSFLRDYEKPSMTPQIFVLPPHRMYGNRHKPDTLIYLPHLQE